MPYFAVTYSLIRLISSLQRQKIWLKRYFQPHLQDFAPDTALKSAHLKKAKQYAWLTVVGVSEAIAELRGKPLTQAEREKQTYLAAVSALFDVMFDEKILPPDRIMTITEQYQTISPQNELERLFVFLLQKLNNNQPFQHHSWQAITAIAAVQQTETNTHQELTYQALWQRTEQKCGNAVLLCAYYMEHHFDTQTLDVLYKIGGVYQVMDDILDYYDDFHAKHDTLITVADAFEDIEIIYRDMIQNIKKEVFVLPLSSLCKQNFWNTISLMYATALVALGQYKRLENRVKPPLASQLPRKALICDMQKMANLARLVSKAAVIHS